MHFVDKMCLPRLFCSEKSLVVMTNQSETDNISKSQSQLFPMPLGWVLPRSCFSVKDVAENLGLEMVLKISGVYLLNILNSIFARNT